MLTSRNPAELEILVRLKYFTGKGSLSEQPLTSPNVGLAHRRWQRPTPEFWSDLGTARMKVCTRTKHNSHNSFDKRVHERKLYPKKPSCFLNSLFQRGYFLYSFESLALPAINWKSSFSTTMLCLQVINKWACPAS